MTGTSSRWCVEVEENGVFTNQLREAAANVPAAVDRIVAQLEDFTYEPQRCGRFLRGSMDGRKRYLVPESAGNGILDELVAVVEVNIYTGWVVPIRLHQPDGPADVQRMISDEIRDAEHCYDI